ncbi:hypothetical protein ACAG39_11965 [Caldicellulosiruptoraceae bacterium PP1]
MNKQNDDKLFTQLFDVEYSGHYKTELKNKLLEQYSKKRRKNVNIYYSLIAACFLILISLIIANYKGNIIQSNISSNKIVFNNNKNQKLAILNENFKNSKSQKSESSQSVKEDNKVLNKIDNDEKGKDVKINEDQNKGNFKAKNNITDTTKVKTESKKIIIVKNDVPLMKKNKVNDKVNHNTVKKTDEKELVKKENNDKRKLKIESNDTDENSEMTLFTLTVPNQAYNEKNYNNQTVSNTTYNEIYSSILEGTYKIDFLNVFKEIFSIEINESVYSSVYEQVYIEVYGYKITYNNGTIDIERITDNNNLFIDHKKAEDIVKRLVPYEFKLIENNGKVDIIEYFDNIKVERDYGFLKFNENILQNAEIMIHNYIVNQPSNKFNIDKIEDYLISEYNITSYNRANLNFIYKKIGQRFILSANYKDGENNYFIENMESKIIK